MNRARDSGLCRRLCNFAHRQLVVGVARGRGAFIVAKDVDLLFNRLGLNSGQPATLVLIRQNSGHIVSENLRTNTVISDNLSGNLLGSATNLTDLHTVTDGDILQNLLFFCFHCVYSSCCYLPISSKVIIIIHPNCQFCKSLLFYVLYCLAI